MMRRMQPAPHNAVTLERRTRSHAEELFAVLAEPLLYEHLDEGPPPSVAWLRDRFVRSESGLSPDGSEQWLNWAVRDAARQMVGYVQATIFPPGEAHVAYVFGSAHWGRGLAFDAVGQMLHILATQFGVTTFMLVTERANTRSVRLAHRLGFAPATEERSARAGLTPTEQMFQRGPA